jgi:hypothetical protein
VAERSLPDLLSRFFPPRLPCITLIKAIGKMRLASALSNGEDELAKTAQQGFPPHRAWFKEKSRLTQHLRAINLSAAEPVMGQLQ